MALKQTPRRAAPSRAASPQDRDQERLKTCVSFLRSLARSLAYSPARLPHLAEKPLRFFRSTSKLVLLEADSFEASLTLSTFLF